MYINPVASKAVLESISRFDEVSIRSEQITKCIEASLDAIANTVVAESNYRASTKFMPSQPHEPIHYKSIFLG